jgi:Fe-S oxidoreductase
MNRSTDGAIMAHRIGRVLQRKRELIKLSLQACAHCALCAESCFKFQASGGDPGFTPSFKALNSIGRIYRKKGRLSESEYETIADLVWNRCALCMRCYCPIGINIPSLIACARDVCRERGVFPVYDGTKRHLLAL